MSRWGKDGREGGEKSRYVRRWAESSQGNRRVSGASCLYSAVQSDKPASRRIWTVWGGTAGLPFKRRASLPSVLCGGRTHSDDDVVCFLLVVLGSPLLFFSRSLREALWTSGRVGGSQSLDRGTVSRDRGQGHRGGRGGWLVGSGSGSHLSGEDLLSRCCLRCLRSWRPESKSQREQTGTLHEWKDRIHPPGVPHTRRPRKGLPVEPPFRVAAMWCWCAPERAGGFHSLASHPAPLSQGVSLISGRVGASIWQVRLQGAPVEWKVPGLPSLLPTGGLCGWTRDD